MRRCLMLLLCASLVACAANPLMKADQPPSPLDEKIASDAVTQLTRLYPPAKTQFNVVPSAPGGFGALLASKLRAKGYAVAESRTVKTGIGAIVPGDWFGTVYPPKPVTETKTDVRPVATPATGSELSYVLDHSRTGDFSRITLKVGNSLLARAYVSDNGTLAPAGAWTFRE
jgi:hypothetical protein